MRGSRYVPYTTNENITKHIPYVKRHRLNTMDDVWKELDKIDKYYDKEFCPFPRIVAAENCVSFLEARYEENDDKTAGLLLAELATKFIYETPTKKLPYQVDLDEAEEILKTLILLKYQVDACEAILQKIYEIRDTEANNTETLDEKNRSMQHFR